nr:11046_t:CDS:2 [Entrophospora candida]
MDCTITLALKLHSIVPHNGTCERVFSVLGWYSGKRRKRCNDNCDEVINLDGVNDSYLIIITEIIGLNSSLGRLLINNNIYQVKFMKKNDINHGDANFDIGGLLDNHDLDQ